MKLKRNLAENQLIRVALHVRVCEKKLPAKVNPRTECFPAGEQCKHFAKERRHIIFTLTRLQLRVLRIKFHFAPPTCFFLQETECKD
jgi:hypothetical protein